MSTTKETTYVICWKRGNELNYFYCGELEACVEFIDKTTKMGYEITDIGILNEEGEPF